MQRFGPLHDQRLRRRKALGDPRAFVEQARHRREGLEVELDDLSSQASDSLEVLGEGLFRQRVVEENALVSAGDAEPQALRPGRERRGRQRAGKSVGLVVAARDLKRRERVGDVERENRDRIERAAGGNDARGRQRPERRLQADDAVERRGNAPRARGVGAERERDEPRADRGRRARARSAGNEIGPQRVARNAIGRAHADEAGGELIEVGLADDDGARPLEPLDDEGRALRPIGEGGTRRGRRQAGDVDIVFDREGNALERLALRPRGHERLGGGERFGLGPQRDEQRRIGVTAILA